jgi:hypothetical protein
MNVLPWSHSTFNPRPIPLTWLGTPGWGYLLNLHCLWALYTGKWSNSLKIKDHAQKACSHQMCLDLTTLIWWLSVDSMQRKHTVACEIKYSKYRDLPTLLSSKNYIFHEDPVLWITPLQVLGLMFAVDWCFPLEITGFMELIIVSWKYPSHWCPILLVFQFFFYMIDSNHGRNCSTLCPGNHDFFLHPIIKTFDEWGSFLTKCSMLYAPKGHPGPLAHVYVRPITQYRKSRFGRGHLIDPFFFDQNVNGDITSGAEPTGSVYILQQNGAFQQIWCAQDGAPAHRPIIVRNPFGVPKTTPAHHCKKPVWCAQDGAPAHRRIMKKSFERVVSGQSYWHWTGKVMVTEITRCDFFLWPVCLPERSCLP